VNVSRLELCLLSGRANHGRRHDEQLLTRLVSALIAVVIRTSGQFRQIDTIANSLNRGVGSRVHLSELPQNYCTERGLGRHISCLSVFSVSDLLQGKQVVNR